MASFPASALAPGAPLQLLDDSAAVPWRGFLRFLGPMLLANVLQVLGGTLNNIYLGQLLGMHALAAAAGFFPVMFFFTAFTIGLGAGASVLIGQAWGAGAAERVRAVAGTTLTVGLLVGLAVALAGGASAPWLLVWLGTPTEVLPQATAYARTMFLGMPVLVVFLLVTSMLRGVGDTVSPLLALLLSTAAGLLLTPALILGWAGLPRLGVASAAWATTASILLALAWLAWGLRRRASVLAPRAAWLRHLRVDAGLLRRVLRLGLPTGVQMMVVALAELAVLALVNRHGAQATAAYGAVNQIWSYAQFPAISVSIAASILGAQAIGAGRSDRLPAILRAGLAVNLALTGTLVLLGYALARPLLGLFLTSGPAIDEAQALLRVGLWCCVVFGMAGVFSGVMRASGAVAVPTAISIGCIAFVELPVAWWLDRLWGLTGIWMSYPVAFGAMLALQAFYYAKVWRKRPIQRLV